MNFEHAIISELGVSNLSRSPTVRESKRCLSAVRFVSFMEDFQRARFGNGQKWLSRKQTPQCVYVEVIEDFSIFPPSRIWHFFFPPCARHVLKRTVPSGAVLLS